MTDWRPTPKQRAMLDAGAEAGLRRSIQAVCEEAGVSRDSFYRWLKTDPRFVAEWESVWHGMIRRYLPSTVAAMVERAQSGDVAAGRLIADMAGVIKQKHEHGGKDGGPIAFTFRIVNDGSDSDNNLSDGGVSAPEALPASAGRDL